MRALERYPELLGFGQAIIVSAAQLPAFEARAMADPAGPLAADGTFQVIPPGPRPFYCFPPTGQARTTAGALPAGFDYCAGGPASAGLLARDTGQGAYIPPYTPHWLANGDSTSLSLTVTFFNRDNADESMVQAFNEKVSRLGIENTCDRASTSSRSSSPIPPRKSTLSRSP